MDSAVTDIRASLSRTRDELKGVFWRRSAGSGFLFARLSIWSMDVGFLSAYASLLKKCVRLLALHGDSDIIALTMEASIEEENTDILKK